MELKLYNMHTQSHAEGSFLLLQNLVEYTQQKSVKF